MNSKFSFFGSNVSADRQIERAESILTPAEAAQDDVNMINAATEVVKIALGAGTTTKSLKNGPEAYFQPTWRSDGARALSVSETNISSNDFSPNLPLKPMPEQQQKKYDYAEDVDKAERVATAQASVSEELRKENA